MCSTLSYYQHHEQQQQQQQQQQYQRQQHMGCYQSQWAYQPSLKHKQHNIRDSNNIYDKVPKPIKANDDVISNKQSPVIKRQRKTNNSTGNQSRSNKSETPFSGTFSAYKSKVSPSRRLKNLLKPLLGRVFKKQADKSKRSSYIASSDKESCEFDWLDNDMDNRANENLEHVLRKELEHCPNEDAAIIVFDEQGRGHLERIDPEDTYVPVHFARTNAGTFFWTSIQRETMEPYRIEWNFHDRWGQA